MDDDDFTPSTRPPRSDRRGKRPTGRRAPQQVRRLDPASTSAESPRDTARRRTRAGKIVDPEKRKRRRRRALIITAVVVVLIFGGAGVAGAWYLSWTQSKINDVMVSNPGLAKSLQQDTPPPGKPFYMLLMGDDRRPGETIARSDTIIVARIDPQLKRVSMLSIPRDTRVAIPGHGMDKINAALALGGYPLAIQTVKNYTGLPISHFLTVDFDGLRYVVDAMGGLWINVPFKIDDNRTNTNWGRKTRVIQPGYQKLDGWKALTLVRARHQFADGDFQRTKDQQMFLKALVKQGLQLSNVFKAPQIVNAVVNHIHTDLKVREIVDLINQFKGMKETDMDGATVPGSPKYMNGISYVIGDDAGLRAMVKRMKAGLPMKPKATVAASASLVPTIPPATINVSIRNGAGVSGLAKQANDYLTKQGFKVVEQGNANQFVYGKTLVVFAKGADAKAAVVADELGFGTVIAANGMYTFKGDVLVVIGKDWHSPTPASSARR
jgi:polyisoprenyl-teichoic acid--peptidoglycan teichoic acid transferase